MRFSKQKHQMLYTNREFFSRLLSFEAGHSRLGFSIMFYGYQRLEISCANGAFPSEAG